MSSFPENLVYVREKRPKRTKTKPGADARWWCLGSLNGTSPFTTSHFLLWSGPLITTAVSPCRVKLISGDIILLLPFWNSSEAMCFLSYLTPQENPGPLVFKYRLASTRRVFREAKTKTGGISKRLKKKGGERKKRNKTQNPTFLGQEAGRASVPTEGRDLRMGRRKPCP